MAAMMLYISLEKGIGNFTESYFTKDFHRKDFGAYAISLYWGGMTISRFILQLKPEKLNRTLCVHFVITGVLFAGLCVSGSAFVSLALCFAVGFACAPIWSGLVALATQQHPEHSGAVSGIMSSSGSVGSTVAPLLMGVVSDSFGIRTGFFLMAVFAMAGAALVLFTNKRK
jgi:fucose permease